MKIVKYIIYICGFHCDYLPLNVDILLKCKYCLYIKCVHKDCLFKLLYLFKACNQGMADEFCSGQDKVHGIFVGLC